MIMADDTSQHLLWSKFLGGLITWGSHATRIRWSNVFTQPRPEVVGGREALDRCPVAQRTIIGHRARELRDLHRSAHPLEGAVWQRDERMDDDA
jgi:hypothetical protein